MASWGLAFEYGKNAYTDMLKKQEELDRYLAERDLWRARLTEEEEAQSTSSKVNREIRKSTELITANKQAILAGDDTAFITTLNQMAEASGGSYQKRKDGKIAYYKDGRQIGDAIDLNSKEYKDGAARLALLTNRLDSAVKIRDTFVSQREKDAERAHDWRKHEATQQTTRRGQDLTRKSAREANEIRAQEVENTLALGEEANKIKREELKIKEKDSETKAKNAEAAVIRAKNVGMPKPGNYKGLDDDVLNSEAARAVYGDGYTVTTDDATGQYILVSPDNTTTFMDADHISDFENMKTSISDAVYNKYIADGTPAKASHRGITNYLQKERQAGIEALVNSVTQGIPATVPSYNMFTDIGVQPMYYGPGNVAVPSSAYYKQHSYDFASGIPISTPVDPSYSSVLNLNTGYPTEQYVPGRGLGLSN